MMVSLFADITLDDVEAKAKIEEVVNAAEGRCPIMTMCKLIGLDVVLNYGVNGEKAKGIRSFPCIQNVKYTLNVYSQAINIEYTLCSIPPSLQTTKMTKSRRTMTTSLNSY